VKKRKFECSECGHVWRVAPGSRCPSVCPECESPDIGLAQKDRSQGRDRTHIRAQRRSSRFQGEEQEEDGFGAG
jgi:hypothetical protein